MILSPSYCPPGLLPAHRQEMEASGIAADVAALNIASFGERTDRHWEHERSELTQYKRLHIQTESRTESGRQQWQPGALSGRLASLDRRYKHLATGGWRSTGDSLPDLPTYDVWKPDDPRQKQEQDSSGQWAPKFDEQGRPVFIKYEAPPGFPDGGGLQLPHVPERCWQLICDRHQLPYPNAPTVAGGFWLWAKTTANLQILIVEGFKKALAAISAGHAAVAVSGVSMGRRNNLLCCHNKAALAAALAQTINPYLRLLLAQADEPFRPDRLIPALQALATADRSWLIVFDHDRKDKTRRNVRAAAGALARCLRAEGGKPNIARLPLLPGAEKTGLDDLWVAGGAEALELALANTGPRPALHHLRQCDAVAPAGAHLSETITLPSDKRLVVIRAPMGSGKTDWIAKAVARYQHEGRRVVLITHRTSLGAACAGKIGLPWAEEAAPGSDLRQTGIALCVDSLHPGSALRFRASEWRDAVVIIDEAAQVLHHTLMGRGTAVADHRAETLVQLSELLDHAHLVLAADAQLGNPHLDALESAVGERAWLIGSAHRPAANRVLFVHPSRDSWRLKLKEAVQNGWRIWISTTAKDQGPNSAKSLAEQIKNHWPEARILVVDSDTVKDPTHDASRLASDPNGIAAAYDVVITTPAIQSGLSVDKTPFDVVFAIAGGNTAPEGVVQSMARVRCDCPRHLYAPLRSPGGRLKIGSGSTDPKQILQSHDHHITVVVGQLARAGVNLETGSIGPWLLLWAKLAAHQNRQAMAFCPTVAALLEEEGYAITHLAEIAPEQQDDALQLRQELKDIANAAQAAADEAIRQVEVISDYDAQELLKKRRRTPSQKTALTRWRLDRSWRLRGAAPSQDLLDQDRDGAWKSHRFRWLITEPSTQPLVAAHDLAIAAKIKWAPDLAHRTLGTKVATALALGLRDWLQRAGGEWFSNKSVDVASLQTTALAHKHDLRQVLGISPAQTGIATLRRLLRLVGAKLESRRNFGNFVDGKRQTHYAYRVVLDTPPDGVDPSALPEVFASSLQEACTKKSPT